MTTRNFVLTIVLCVVGGLSAMGQGPDVTRRTNGGTVTSAEMRPLTLRVLVLNYDPFFEGKRLHQVLGFNDPRELAKGYISDLESSTKGLLRFEIVEWRDLDEIYAREDGGRFTVGEYVRNRRAGGGWPERIVADYPRLLAEQRVVPMIDSAQIDEVWIFGDHFFGLWEASMAGPGAFFINGGVYPQVESQRPFAFYGFNYERGVAEMLHNTAHRVEATMNRVYGAWNLKDPLNNWEKFSANVDQSAGVAGVGTCHWPANAAHDYDYANKREVMSWADDFLNYPNLTGQKKPVSVLSWSPEGVDPHRGYMKWYFQRLPKAVGVNDDGRLNNWLPYIFDFQNYNSLGKPSKPTAFVIKAEHNAGNFAVMLAYRSAAGVSVAGCKPDDVQLTIPSKSPMPARRVYAPDKMTGTYRVASYVFDAGATLPDSVVLTLVGDQVTCLDGTTFATQSWSLSGAGKSWSTVQAATERKQVVEVVQWILESGGKIGVKDDPNWIESVAELPASKPAINRLKIDRVSLLRKNGDQEPIGWNDVASLMLLKDLVQLELRAQPIGDRAAPSLAKLSKLRVLNLHDCLITDKALSELTQLRSLERLDIGFSHGKITDEGATQLLKFRKLQWLNIYASSITDKTLLSVLAKLPALNTVEVTSTQVSEEGIARFKVIKPGCTVLKYR